METQEYGGPGTEKQARKEKAMRQAADCPLGSVLWRAKTRDSPEPLSLHLTDGEDLGSPWPDVWQGDVGAVCQDF